MTMSPRKRRVSGGQLTQSPVGSRARVPASPMLPKSAQGLPGFESVAAAEAAAIRKAAPESTRKRRRPEAEPGAAFAPSEKDAKLAQKLGQLQPFIAAFPQECMGQLASFVPT